MTTKQVPQYVCHKVVGALQIKSIVFDADLARESERETDGSATITPIELDYQPFKVNSQFLRKHPIEVGGYIVFYQDGYTSFSPKKAFEEGYKLIQELKPTMPDENTNSAE